jgi:predicted transposase/invertase (TIGR01784 family)
MTILLKDNPAITKAHQKYVTFTQDDQARMAYEARIAFQRDQLSREQAAEKKGKLEGRLETARSFKALGISLEQIAQATGLSLDEVKKL